MSAQIITALRNRADELQDLQEYGALHGVKRDSTEAVIRSALITEFRALADEAEGKT